HARAFANHYTDCLGGLQNRSVRQRPKRLAAVPETSRYAEGLKRLASAMTPKHTLMLLHHYRSSQHTVTCSALAKVADYKDWNSVNLQYGTLARRLADSMRWIVPPGSPALY